MWHYQDGLAVARRWTIKGKVGEFIEECAVIIL